MKTFKELMAEAKATYCGRCGTTHVPPSKGGTCPALNNEEVEQIDEASLGDHKGLRKYSDNLSAHYKDDKTSFEIAADHIKSGDKKSLGAHLRSSDTDVRDKILNHVHKSHWADLGYKSLKEEVDLSDIILEEDEMIEEGTITLGGSEHNTRRVPIEHHDEFKKTYPGSTVRFRGPKKGKDNTSKSDATHFYIVNKKEKKVQEGTFDNIPKSDAGWNYLDKKRAQRNAEHQKQDPKTAAAGYAKNMVDTEKAAKKANERGIKKSASDFDWKVRNGVQRGKLPEEAEIEEAKDVVVKDKEGKVKSWSHEGDWKKADKKDPVGKIHNLSDKARRQTAKMTNEETQGETMSTMEQYLAAIEGNADFRGSLDEKKLTPAEMKKREEVAQAIERENPGMEMGKKMAIATATAKKVAEETIEEAKAHTEPKTDKEKDLAALAHPKDKITHADVMVGRGVKKEELSSKEKMKRGMYNEAMISYSDFRDKIAMHKKAGNKVQDDKYTNNKATYTTVDKDGMGRKVTHTASGTKMETLGKMGKQDDDESDETEVKQTEKRGRGRPSGSKSGARH